MSNQLNNQKSTNQRAKTLAQNYSKKLLGSVSCEIQLGNITEIYQHVNGYPTSQQQRWAKQINTHFFINSSDSDSAYASGST